MILAKMGELVLKGMNRRNFENRMLRTIRRRVGRYGEFDVYSMQSVVYISPKSDCDEEGAYAAVLRVFGLASVCRAYECEKDRDAILESAIQNLAPDLMRAKSFKVESKRSDKSFHMTSIELSRDIGGELSERFPHLKVDVHRPEVTVYVEIRDRAAYVHANPTPGAGGLPSGSGGRAALLLSGGIDSPVAGYTCARRGLELEAVHFFSYPYTSERAKGKVLDLAKILVSHTGYMTVHVVNFTAIQERIRDRVPEEYFTLIMRRSMMRIASQVARRNECAALITGESLGQVASQTLQALVVTDDAAELPVFRPLIGMDKTEVTKIAQKIGTFETSILPYEDCCTVFTPRHPRTKPKLEDTRALDLAADLAELEAAAVESVELERIRL